MRESELPYILPTNNCLVCFLMGQRSSVLDAVPHTQPPVITEGVLPARRGPVDPECRHA